MSCAFGAVTDNLIKEGIWPMSYSKLRIIREYRRQNDHVNLRKFDNSNFSKLGIYIKGSLMVDYVKMIRANKDKPWDKYLTLDDWDIIDGSVLSSSWYPFESFRRMGGAIFREIAQSNLDIVRGFGRQSIDNFLLIYRNILNPGNPLMSLNRFAEIRQLYIKGDFDIKVMQNGGNWLKYQISAPRALEFELFEAFTYQLAGNGEGIVDRAGGKNVSSEVDKAGEFFNIALSWH